MEGHLLLVDDEPAVRELLHEYFAGQGYTVSTAPNGEMALAAVRAQRPDLVMLDIRMPGLDGVEVLRRLRRHDTTLPVVMVTANEDVELARELLGMGAFDYVAKPFDFSHLEQVVAAGLLHAAPSRKGGGDGVDAWAAVATAVFAAARAMTEPARRSTGARLEDALLAAARASLAGRGDAVRSALAELRLLLRVAVELGDLPAGTRDGIAAALERVGTQRLGVATSA
jgi:two-component system response regulator (stage 0 sporulation protein F)